MQVGVDVVCMHANCGGRGFFNFGYIATLKFEQIFLLDHGLWSMVVKKFRQIKAEEFIIYIIVLLLLQFKE